MSRGRARQPGPWLPAHAAAAVGAQALAVTLVLLGWFVAAGRLSAADQSPWLQVTVGGLLLSGLVNAWWLAVGRATLRRARAALPIGPGPSVELVADDDALVGLTDGVRVHRVGCALVAGKPVVPIGGERASAGGRRPCEVCLP